MVVHLWNGSDKSDSAPSGTYTVSATYFYNDGTSIMTEEQTNESRLLWDRSAGTDHSAESFGGQKTGEGQN